MRKVAIFVEGQSELIFLRRFLPILLGWERISFECWELYADRMSPVPYKHASADADTHFWIMNVRNDERVLSAIKERETRLIQQGYERIIGLRDMYSQAYRNKAGPVIDDTIIGRFISGAHETIQKMGNPDKIWMCFAIMELEAWFLGIFNVFKRLDPVLTVAYIEQKLGFNLGTIDPQTEFLKPADKVDNILQLVGLRYQKSRDDVESICSKMHIDDLSTIFENGRCASLKDLCDELAGESACE